MVYHYFFIVLRVILNASIGFAKGTKMPDHLTGYHGRTFTGSQDFKYPSYDQALLEYLVKRIGQPYGITLDPLEYSGFDLLEIEVLFNCKKSNESYDLFLKMFAKGR